MSFDDYLDAFPGEEFCIDSGVHAPEAKIDAQTTILSLPTELLLAITEYCHYWAVSNLMRVNKTLHQVGMTRFYQSVHIQAAYWRIDEFPEDASDQTLVSHISGKHLGCVPGLLSSQRHLETMKLFHVVSYPNDPKQLALFSKVVRRMLDNATRLQEIDFPPFYDRQEFISPLQGLLVPPMLKTLKFAGDPDLISILLRDANVKVLRNKYPNYPLVADVIENIPSSVDRSLEDFGSSWHVCSERGQFVQKFTSRFVNLKTLSVGLCRCDEEDPWSNEYQPDPSLHRRLVQSLPRLEELTIVTHAQLSDHREHDLIKILSSAQPSLRLITFSPTFVYTGVSESIQWRKTHDISMNITRWTPDPSLRCRWNWWENEFGDLVNSHPYMEKYWSDESRVPYLYELQWRL